jgi:hypothetical protein
MSGYSLHRRRPSRIVRCDSNVSAKGAVPPPHTQRPFLSGVKWSRLSETRTRVSERLAHVTMPDWWSPLRQLTSVTCSSTDYSRLSGPRRPQGLFFPETFHFSRLA